MFEYSLILLYSMKLLNGSVLACRIILALAIAGGVDSQFSVNIIVHGAPLMNLAWDPSHPTRV